MRRARGPCARTDFAERVRQRLKLRGSRGEARREVADCPDNSRDGRSRKLGQIGRQVAERDDVKIFGHARYHATAGLLIEDVP